MAFKVANLDHVAKFNSADSCNLLDIYDSYLEKEIKNHRSSIPSKTFAPSSIRCERRSWFRLRGTEPDVQNTVDTGLQFTADIGTACHELIQSRLSKALGDRWCDVESHIKSIYPSAKCLKSGYEVRVELQEPPIKFSVDGLIGDTTRKLLEIKSCDHMTFEDLTNPKEEHIPQFECYCTLLHVSGGFFLYVDRQYGDMKCYEMSVMESKKIEYWQMFDRVKQYAKFGIAPDPLKDTKWCDPNMCPYYKKCKEY